MSDLDADLYGGEFNASVTGDSISRRLDLYGNDEGGEEQAQEEQPQEENDTQQQPPQEAPTESPPASTLPSQYTQQQAPQKIPTYEEPQPSEYREPQQVRSDGVYQNIPVNERSVRPSEMKDEG
jgi:hypothetical protein